MKEEDQSKLFDIDLFDESNLSQHQQKLIIIFGVFYGLRGSKETTYLTIQNISQGWYDRTHLSFAGLEWYGLQDPTNSISKCRVGNCVFAVRVGH